MRVWIGFLGRAAMFAAPVLMIAAPARAQEPHALDERSGSTSDAKAAELKVYIERARQRQRVVDRHNTELWQRWTYAVCVGCGGAGPGPHPSVFTTPARVLAGIPAAEDDARARRGRGRTRGA